MTETRHWLDEQAEPDQSLLDAKDRLLTLIEQETPLETVLEQICRAIEEEEPGILSSVLLVSPEGDTLLHGAAPSLPDAYCTAIDGIAIGEGVGSCGTAAATRRPIVAEDVSIDPNWVDFKDLAAEHGLAACYSSPVKDDDGRVVATFAIYRRTPGPPSLRERQLTGWFRHLVDVAIRLQPA